MMMPSPVEEIAQAAPAAGTQRGLRVYMMDLLPTVPYYTGSLCASLGDSSKYESMPDASPTTWIATSLRGSTFVSIRRFWMSYGDWGLYPSCCVVA